MERVHAGRGIRTAGFPQTRSHPGVGFSGPGRDRPGGRCGELDVSHNGARSLGREAGKVRGEKGGRVVGTDSTAGGKYE